MSLLLPVKSWFDDEAESNRANIEEFGEWLTFTPTIRRPNQQSAIDPSRQSFSLQAVFERQAKMLGLGMEETKVSTRELCLHALLCDLKCVVRQADQFTLCTTRELFEVTNTEKDGVSGIAIHLIQLGIQQ